mmetsp:Transcript_15823/g.17645  ORF Transcript_15823/g.17645 Transcript_15823/m.17645 type:complete len:95 (+) Transcript_15823:440-724(+)
MKILSRFWRRLDLLFLKMICKSTKNSPKISVKKVKLCSFSLKYITFTFSFVFLVCPFLEYIESLFRVVNSDLDSNQFRLPVSPILYLKERKKER